MHASMLPAPGASSTILVDALNGFGEMLATLTAAGADPIGTDATSLS
jgi:hypothetical protein